MSKPPILKTFIETLRGRLGREKNDPREWVLQRMPKHAVCAEIGVWKGDFSQRIYSITTPGALHLIDPWRFQPEFSNRMYGGAVAKSQLDMDSIYEEVTEKFKGFDNVFLGRGDSETILKEFSNGYFDWVYIDGNHYFDWVKKDLDLCFVKVRRGGFIAGDDFCWGKKEGFPVERAVREFVVRHKLERNLIVNQSQFIIEL